MTVAVGLAKIGSLFWLADWLAVGAVARAVRTGPHLSFVVAGVALSAAAESTTVAPTETVLALPRWLAPLGAQVPSTPQAADAASGTTSRRHRQRSSASSRVVIRAGEFGGVIRCFLRDRNVMWMALPNAGRGDLDESRFRAQFFDRLRAAVAHAGPQSADQLIHKRLKWSLERNAAFDPFGHELAGARVRSAVGGSVRSSP